MMASSDDRIREKLRDRLQTRRDTRPRDPVFDTPDVAPPEDAIFTASRWSNVVKGKAVWIVALSWHRSTDCERYRQEMPVDPAANQRFDAWPCGECVVWQPEPSWQPAPRRQPSSQDVKARLRTHPGQGRMF